MPRLTALKLDRRDVTLIFDKGNLSREAFKRIDKEKIGFITSLRNSTQKDLLVIPQFSIYPDHLAHYPKDGQILLDDPIHI